MARAAFVVIVDLDPIPGAFHTEKSAKENVEAILLNNIPHYHPVVLPFEE